MTFQVDYKNHFSITQIIPEKYILLYTSFFLGIIR